MPLHPTQHLDCANEAIVEEWVTILMRCWPNAPSASPLANTRASVRCANEIQTTGHELANKRIASDAYLRYRDKLAKPGLIIYDDFGMRKLSSTEAKDLCEMERSYGKAIVFSTQLPLDHWSEVIADPVIADAVRERLEHTRSRSTSPGRVTAASKHARTSAPKAPASMALILVIGFDRCHWSPLAARQR